MFFKRDTFAVNLNGMNENIKSCEPCEPQKPEEEWIWVDGYKGTDKNMQCKNNFQYEIGKTYTCDGKIKICDNGFHFCRDLDDAIKYISAIYNNRFFKVKGLVRKSDYEKYGEKEVLPLDSTYYYGLPNVDYHDKLVAKEITIVEEISREERYELLKKYRENYGSSNKEVLESYNFLESIDDMEKFLDNYEVFKTKKVTSTLSKIGFCDSLCTILSDKIDYEKVQWALALHEQNISIEMMVYFILNYKS